MNSATFHIDLPNWQQHNVPLKVVAEVHPCEPDVGIMGNGKVSLCIVAVYCSEDGYDPEENIIHCFSNFVATWDIIEAEQASALCDEMVSIYQQTEGEFGWPNCDHL